MRLTLAIFTVGMLMLLQADALFARSVAFEKMLSPLNSAEDVAGWKQREVNEGQLTWEATRDEKVDRIVARLVNPTKDRVLYPGINFVLNGGTPIDASVYTDVVFEARAINLEKIPLQMVMVDDGGIPQYGDVPVTNQWETHRVTLPRSFQQRKLGQIQLGYNEPRERYVVHIANLRLENRNVSAALNRLNDRIRDGAFQLTDEQNAELKRLSAGLKRLERSTDEADLGKWMDAVRELNRGIYQHQLELQAGAFERHIGAAPWGYGWADSASKVFRVDRISPIRYAEAGEIKLARNEYEAIQLVLRSRQDVRNVSVRITDLQSDNGASISADRISLMPVGYINTRWPAYDVDYVGWYPDPLLDYLKAFEMAANAWQPVWIEVQTSAEQPAGAYRGTITVTGDDMPALEIPLVVNVWNFAVPHEKHAMTAINHFDGTEVVSVFESQYAPQEHADFTSFHKYLWHQLPYDAVKDNATVQRLLALREKQNRVIAEHRMNPRRIYAEPTPYNEEVQAVKDAGFSDYCIMMIWSQRQLRAGEPYPADLKQAYLAQLEEAVPRLKAAGLLEGAYVYGFDEANDNEFAAIKDIFGEIKKRWPELKTMTTAYDYSYGLETGLADVVDIWVPLTPHYMRTLPQVEKARAAGEEIWWYVCLVPAPGYANVLVEDAAVEPRLLLGFMPFKYASQGFLYYSLNYWKTGEQHVPFAERLNTGVLTNQNGRAWGEYNGDGLLFYAGDEGPVVTQRMKNMRDGLEDYEYLQLLQKQYELAKAGSITVPDGWLKEAADALSVKLITSMTDFPRAGSVVIEARNKIGALLDAAN